MQLLSRIIDLGWCFKKDNSSDTFLAISTLEEADVDFDFILVNGVRYEKPQNQPDE